jgi:hypothetical protein
MIETDQIKERMMILEKQKKMLPPTMPPADVEMVEAKDEDDNFVTVDGVLIKQDFDRFILDESEVDKYTPLQCTSMEQTLYVKYSYDIQVLTYFLYSYYADVQVAFPTNKEDKFDLKFVIDGSISVSYF